MDDLSSEFSREVKILDSFEDETGVSRINDAVISTIQSKHMEKNLLIKELNQVASNMANATCVNREMFQVVSEQLSKITENLNKRQLDLISILTNFSDPEEISLQIQKLGNLKFRLRNKKILQLY